ncbi:MAG: tyrosine-type recombinase/integrase [Clostridiales bacterium]|nr:tyrosine-type recombinase/integrase [Clostridiales bacterium]
MNKENSYYSKRQNENTIRLRRVLKDLPKFCAEFFRGIDHNTSILTRVNYAYDLRLFFNYITEDLEEFKGISPTDLSIDDLNSITVTHIEMFLNFLTLYTNDDDIEYANRESGKARKLSTLRSFFLYFHKKGSIDKNVASLVSLPKIHDKPIIRLEVDEIVELLDMVDSGDGLTETQQRYHNYTRKRDLAIIMLLLGTGIRISECVGLNMSDIDFDINGFMVTRKGGSETILYFSEEVRKALLDYIEERKEIDTLPGHEDALLLSLQRRRISVRAVQNLVKKYSKHVTPLKNISPHKLRSTFGTNLYRETGDIYLVADVLGHEDVNTTKRHYAATSDEMRRQAARIVKLRDD